MNPAARSIFAVVDGLLLYLALRGAFYAVAYLGLHFSFDTPTPTYLGCNLGWALLAAVLSGYTAARVARRSPLLHGLIVAIPFILLIPLNLFKGVGGRHTLFVLAFNCLVPLAFVLGAWLYGRARNRLNTKP